MYLFFDTETTGKVDFAAPANAEHQPHLVQLGAILTDEDGTVRGEVNLLVKPDGYEIPADVVAIHGITTEIATRYGVLRLDAIDAFCVLAARACVRVAHNLDFDDAVMAAAFAREGFDFQKRFGAHCRCCTMKDATPICKLPGRYGYKWPNLQEAHRHFLGQGFDAAHDAMADVRACMRVFFEIKKLKQAGLA